MSKTDTKFDYERLVKYMLPKGMLDMFEVTCIKEECTGTYDETNTEIRILRRIPELEDEGIPCAGLGRGRPALLYV